MEIQLEDIGNIIKLAITPALMLIGVGSYLRVLNNRLARVVKRLRVLEQRLDDGALPDAYKEEVAGLHRRRMLINRAIVLNAGCTLLICVVIAALFVSDIFDLPWFAIVGALFVAGVLCLTGSFLYFLMEISVATRTLTLSVQRIFAEKR